MRLTRLAPIAALALTATVLGISPAAHAVGPGGWDHLGTQISSGNTASALSGDVLAMNTNIPGVLLAGGKFTNAGGVTGADHVASWNGSAWSAVGPPASFNGDVHALAVAGGKIYAGGTFTNAGGDAAADFLAVYDGVSWKHVCTGGGAPFDGNVHALQVIGNFLYIGGTFAGVDGLLHTHALVRCDLTSDTPSSTTLDPAHEFTGSVYALTADSAGNLYAGGGFQNVDNHPTATNIAMLSPGGVWSGLGSGPGLCGCAVDSFVRSLADDGTTLYIGADSVNIAGIAQADHVAAWNGSSWRALGANAGGTDGYLPGPVSVYALFTAGSHVYATGSWLNAGGDPTADLLADFDGSSWKPVGSNGAGDGALNAVGESMAMYGGVLHVGGNFTKAGGDSLASFIARYTGVPSNAIALGKVHRNPAKGTAKLSVSVPGAGALALAGKGVKKVQHSAAGAGKAVLQVRVKGKTLRQLKARGKVKVKVTVTFTPTGGFPRSETKKVKLVLKRR